MHKNHRASIAIPIHRIIPISTVDGPGARTAIFVQGCNLACAYCHNPETIALCCHCGLCVPGCPTQALQVKEKRVDWTKASCVDCGQCEEICPYSASPKVEWMTAENVFDRIRPNLPFIRGITTSGGECTLYPGFLTKLFTLAKSEGLTTLMDANGTVDLSKFPELLSVTDGVMLDLKAWDLEVFKKLTGKKATGNLSKNLRNLSQQGKLQEIRLVCQEEWVDVVACLQGVKDTLPHHFQKTPLKIIAFRRHGVQGAMKDTKPPSKEDMEGWAAFARKLGYQQILIR